MMTSKSLIHEFMNKIKSTSKKLEISAEKKEDFKSLFIIHVIMERLDL